MTKAKTLMKIKRMKMKMMIVKVTIKAKIWMEMKSLKMVKRMIVTIPKMPIRTITLMRS
jgi:hypothetical protein